MIPSVVAVQVESQGSSNFTSIKYSIKYGLDKSTPETSSKEIDPIIEDKPTIDEADLFVQETSANVSNRRL